MEIWKECPRVLLHKLFLTLLIGAGCLLVGIAYFCFAHDLFFLILSAVVFATTLVRCVGLYRVATRKQYEVVEGVCIRVSAKPLRRYRKVSIMDTEGLETTLMLEKQARIKIGYCYRFFFKQDSHLSLGSEYLDTALSTDRLLGFEEIGEFTASSQENQGGHPVAS